MINDVKEKYKVVYIDKLGAEYLGLFEKIDKAFISDGFLADEGEYKFYLKDVLNFKNGREQNELFKKAGVLL